MTDPAAVADRIESDLAPLYTRACHAWWDLNVAATDETFKKAPKAKGKGHEQTGLGL